MRVQIQNWSNRLAIRIPKTIEKVMPIKDGASVDLAAVKGKLMISPIVEPEYSLEQLLAVITKENLHDAVDTGAAIGKEAW